MKAPHDARRRRRCRAGSTSALLAGRSTSPLALLVAGARRAACSARARSQALQHPGRRRVRQSARRSATRSTTPPTSSSPGSRSPSRSTPGLFNIGAEGQAYVGGLGVGAGLPRRSATGRRWLADPARRRSAAAVFGAAWAFLPGWLQAQRGSHVVITTIMFNFIAAALMTYLLVNVLIKPGQQSPETREFAPDTWLPQLHEIARVLGCDDRRRSPLNLVLLAGARAAGARLALPLAHALGLRAARPRPQRDGRALRRHRAGAHDHRRHVDLRARSPGCVASTRSWACSTA